jgi:hypothetical protein
MSWVKGMQSILKFVRMTFFSTDLHKAKYICAFVYVGSVQSHKNSTCSVLLHEINSIYPHYMTYKP